MSVCHTPDAASGNMPQCNNDERKWFGNAMSTSLTMRQRAIAMRNNDINRAEDVREFYGELTALHAKKAGEWRALVDRMEARGREDAADQASTRGIASNRIFQEARDILSGQPNDLDPEPQLEEGEERPPETEGGG